MFELITEHIVWPLAVALLGVYSVPIARRLVLVWAWLATIGMSALDRSQWREEVSANLSDEIETYREEGHRAQKIAVRIVARLILGAPDDLRRRIERWRLRAGYTADEVKCIVGDAYYGYGYSVEKYVNLCSRRQGTPDWGEWRARQWEDAAGIWSVEAPDESGDVRFYEPDHYGGPVYTWSNDPVTATSLHWDSAGNLCGLTTDGAVQFYDLPAGSGAVSLRQSRLPPR